VQQLELFGGHKDMLLNILILSMISVLAVYMVLQVMYLLRKRKMHAREVQLKQVGSSPFGSGLCHGMVLNERKDGVISDHKKSSAWYSRLLQ
jgi:hypothetical protein